MPERPALTLGPPNHPRDTIPAHPHPSPPLSTPSSSSPHARELSSRPQTDQGPMLSLSPSASNDLSSTSSRTHVRAMLPVITPPTTPSQRRWNRINLPLYETPSSSSRSTVPYATPATTPPSSTWYLSSSATSYLSSSPSSGRPSSTSASGRSSASSPPSSTPYHYSSLPSNSTSTGFAQRFLQSPIIIPMTPATQSEMPAPSQASLASVQDELDDILARLAEAQEEGEQSWEALW